MGRNRHNSIPEGWQGCPSMSTGFIDDRFFVFKTPLKPDLNNKLPQSERFSIPNIFQRLEHMNHSRIGLWIDLTNTSRYYNPSELVNRGIQYEKLTCEGRVTPSKRAVSLFCNLVHQYFRRNRYDYIGVHCTHGFNRTGYLICCYLIRYRKYTPAEAVYEFSRHRHPGIYRQMYVDDLYTMSSPPENPIKVSEPEWVPHRHQNHVTVTPLAIGATSSSTVVTCALQASSTDPTEESQGSHNKARSIALLPTTETLPLPINDNYLVASPSSSLTTNPS